MEMNTYLNRSVDPCNSFYDFACNGWENKHLLEYLVQVLSNGGSEFDNFVKAQLKIEENFEKILLLHNENNESNGYEQGMIGVNAVQTPTVWSDPTVGPSSSSMSIQSNSSLSVPSEQLSLFSTTSRSLKDSEPLIAIAKLSPSSSNLILPIVNTRKIYTRCVNANKEINQVALEKVLSDIGGWPLLTGKFNRETYRWENYFDVVVIFRPPIQMNESYEIPTAKTILKILIAIKSVGFIVSRRKLLSVKLNRLESYANYIHSTLIHFGASNHKNDTIDQVWKMIKFEKKLAENYTSVGSNTTQESYAKELLHFYSKVQANKIHQIFEKVGDKINKSHLWDPLPLHVGATYDFVGHIIAHSVTPRYNEFDELLPPWNANFLKEYLFKAQCFVSQYTSYYDKEAELHLDGTKTFEEDMSDLAGIQAAYLAFRNISKHFGGQQSSEQSSLNSQRIQELTEYSNDKLFFISFAQRRFKENGFNIDFCFQKWCRSNTHLQTRMRISKSVHSPEKYRVNGALSNFKEFSRIFDCPEGSPMNPVKRCESW
ncbi:neprilysin-like protein 4 [Sarcoptes scabiei]|uniref:Neprilysin-like protein 4 n=1 Tax=Sarcoptes scabiei TaxID=52283 RepID=A0A132AH69_SARSC|nr:neprilysin-like protein 4 [Sarcoptes scabiei]